MLSDYENDPAVNNLRNYLRIRSVHPNVNYDECLTYLRGQAAEMGLPVQVYEPLPKKPILVMTWEGYEPKLPSVLLNSHMDVVPVFEKSWTYPPFEAHLEKGVIYGRGVQDMKSVAVQYIEAVKRIKAKGRRLKRTVHLSFVPDEEIGGGPGMGEFVKTDAFKALNVGFALDEGIASATEEFLVFNGERTIWRKVIDELLVSVTKDSVPTRKYLPVVACLYTNIQSYGSMRPRKDMTIICPGKSGHGSLLLPDNSGEKLRYMIDKFMDLRKESVQKLADNPDLTIGDVTSVNLTMLSGGIQNNVVPEKLTASFDIRIALSVDLKQFESEIRRWCAEAGYGVTFEFEQKDPYVAPTKLDNTNAYWLAFKAAAEQIKIKLKPCTFTGGTDSRYLRELGIPALGFSPMSKTTPGLHEDNEHLSADTFLRGIGIFEALIPAVANV